jgi:predicted aspartyl protease
MPHFTLSLTQEAPIVVMFVAVSGAKAQALTAANQTIPAAQNICALVDTGASHTCVDPMVFTSLGLQPTGSTSMLTPSTGATPINADTYDVGIVIPNGTQQGLVIANMPVSASELYQAQGFHALIGRDILERCVLTYNGAMAMFTLAY